MKYADVVDTGWISSADSIGDMQIDLTSGYPTIVFYDFDRGVLWLEPVDLLEPEFEELWTYADKECRKYGVRPVYDSSDVNSILLSLGGDALDWLLPDNE